MLIISYSIMAGEWKSTYTVLGDGGRRDASFHLERMDNICKQRGLDLSLNGRRTLFVKSSRQ